MENKDTKGNKLILNQIIDNAYNFLINKWLCYSPKYLYSCYYKVKQLKYGKK